MIRYALICDQGHEFEGWFPDSAAFENQQERRLVCCTHCGSHRIEKQLMAPGIAAKSNKVTHTMAAGPVDPRSQMLMQMMREMRKSIAENSEYVGDKFAEQARQMHYSEIEKRGIYGEAKPEEAKALVEEGIEVFPLPSLPEDAN